MILHLKKKEEEKNKEIIKKGSNGYNELDNLGDIHSIVTIEENKNEEEKEEDKESNKQYENIIVNEINKDKNKLKGKKRDIVINNIFINCNNNINIKNNLKHKLNRNETINNDESVYSSIKGDSEHNYKEKILDNKKRVHFNDSLNNSSIRYNSNDNFVHHLIFSESSSISEDNNK